ncbi:MAG TPA: prolipoprotein diacylglyceryl transferase family protein [Bacteroidia bacterium]|nr:prolipoprotein diacylglyceryl transferase family protein [Bacteroidia bacterium]
MYPSISDLLKDLFSINIPLPVQTFGFFVAVAFLSAAWFLQLELRRKEHGGLLSARKVKVLQGAPPSAAEIISGIIISFILGFKLPVIVLRYSDLVDNPAGLLFSSDGYVYAGIIAALIFAYTKYREFQKSKTKKPEWIEVTVHPHELVGNITLAAAVGGLIGAKVFHMLEYPEDFLADPIGSIFSGSGLTMYGGLIVGAITTIYYAKKNGIAPEHIIDATAPSLMLAYGVGRIGCQLAGDGDWGIDNLNPKPSSLSFLPDWFWSYNYPHNVNNVGIPIPGCEGKHCMMLAQGVYPTPLYESIICISLFFVLWFMRKKINVPGVLFSVYLILNGIERFFIEHIRVNAEYHVAGISFTQAQLISLMLIVTGIAGIFFFRSRKTIST